MIKNLVTLFASSSIFFSKISRSYIFAESFDAIAAIDLSLLFESSLAEPAVSAEIIVLNLFFIIIF